MKIFLYAAIYATFFANLATAQGVTYDLQQLPFGFEFESKGDDGITTLRYTGWVGNRFTFDQTSVADDGSSYTIVVTTNRQSQTVLANSSEYNAAYTPHDCAPTSGPCAYSATIDGAVYAFARDTYQIQDVWVFEQYYNLDGAWIFDTKGCTTLDEYGFWVDFVVYDDQGEIHWGARTLPALETPINERMDHIRNICTPVMLLT